MRRKAAWLAWIGAGIAVAVVSCDRKPAGGGGSGGAAPTVMVVAEPPPDPALVSEGERLHTLKGCISCHTTDGSEGMGPTAMGFYGKVQTMADGRRVLADAEYVQKSIFDPQADVLPGFVAQMQSYKGLVTEKDIAALIAYYKTLKAGPEEGGGH